MMDDLYPTSRATALDLLRSLGAPAHLLSHCEIVSEVAEQLCDAMEGLGVNHQRELVIIAAAMHDAGKIVHPEELHGPGHRHECAGEALLLNHHVSMSIARCCRSHGSWETDEVSFAELVIALADHLWKGTRDERLESLVIQRVARQLAIDRWEAMLELDVHFERIAAGAADRLARAR